VFALHAASAKRLQHLGKISRIGPQRVARKSILGGALFKEVIAISEQDLGRHKA
jgi:hypothetical protein